MTIRHGDNRTREELLGEIEQLHYRLDEAEQTLEAIRSGDVDALIVAGPHGDQIFSLTGSERLYRQIVETMNEGALTVGLDGTILFCNQRFCSLIKYSMAEIIGGTCAVFSAAAQLVQLKMFLDNAQAGPVQQLFLLRASDGATVPVNIAASMLVMETDSSICLVVSDLTALEAQSSSIENLLRQQNIMEAQQYELHVVNEELRNSQRAALNLVEDVEIARQKAEESNQELQQEILVRTQAEDKIKASLAEKDVMLREIHHRVKNNLQVISSLVSLQADTLADAGMREVFGDVRDRVRAMALVHEKLYQTGDLAHLNFADYAASLLQYLWRSYGALAENVRLNLAVAPVTLSIEAAVPCGLILNELAGNALKHAFPNGSSGEVVVGLELDSETQTVCLWVHDNGAGLPPGLEWRQAGSLGLRLVQMLAGQLRGTVETGSGPGAEFRVTFPLKGFQS